MNAAEIHYKIAWRARGNFPGHHSSQQKGGGLQFRNHAPLIDAQDPRRFDVHASLRDPFEQIQVRIYRQTGAIPVFVVADLSASMNFVGANSKPKILVELVASLSDSVYRTGDRFGFIGATDQHSVPWWLPATTNRAAGNELTAQLRTCQPAAENSEGLLKAAELIGARRALVFVVSDFHFPFPLLEQVLASLAHHDVVPTLLWDRHEYEQLPRFGLVRIADRETQRSRLLLLRPSLRKRVKEEFVARRAHLEQIFGRYGRAPLVLKNGFDADEVTHYFFG